MNNHREAIEKILDCIPTHDHMIDSISLDLDTTRYCTQAFAYALLAAAEILADATRSKNVVMSCDLAKPVEFL